MYDFSGIVYRLWMTSVPKALLGIIGLVLFASKRFSPKRDKRKILLSFVALMIALGYACYYAYCLENTNIQVFEGIYLEELHKGEIAPFTFSYSFIDKSGEKKWLYLDVFSGKKIYPVEFMEGSLYRIYYDKETRIIVKVIQLE